MVWYKNPLLKTILQSELKKTNQRIFEIARQYGENSAVYNKYTKSSWTSAAEKYVTRGTRYLHKGKKDPIDVLKIDISKINKLVASGKADRTELNNILSNLAGIKINENGDVERIANQGVKTIKQIEKATTKRLENMGEDPREKSKQEVKKITEHLAEFDQNFQSAYEKGMARAGESALKNNPVTSYLWSARNGGKRGDRRLTYREMENILEELNKITSEAQNKALKFEENNGGNI